MLPEHWLIFDDNNLLLLKSGDTYSPPLTEHISHLLPHCPHQHLVKTDEHSRILCAELLPGTNLPANIESVPLRKALNTLGEQWYAMIVRGYTILRWDKNHQYCGQCGSQTEYKSNVFERYCPACKLAMYPRISPSVIVRITNKDQILMARSHHFAPGSYGLIAGFVEAGENLEDAVHREVKEEIGISITNLQYFGSQPWPFPDSLMIGFTADYHTGDLVIDPSEIEHADWYRYDQLPGWPSSSISIARKLIDDFILKQQQVK